MKKKLDASSYTTPRDTTEDACGASAYQNLVGAPAAAAENASAPGPVRTFRSGQPITMDYRLDRLNFELDERDRIIRVFCG